MRCITAHLAPYERTMFEIMRYVIALVGLYDISPKLVFRFIRRLFYDAPRNFFTELIDSITSVSAYGIGLEIRQRDYTQRSET